MRFARSSPLHLATGAKVSAGIAHRGSCGARRWHPTNRLRGGLKRRPLGGRSSDAMQLRWGLVLLVVLGAAAAESSLDDVSKVLTSSYKDCWKTWSHTCLQKKVLVFVDRLDSVRSIPLLDGWTVETTASPGSRALRHPITEEELASVGEGRSNSAAADEILSDMLDNRLSEFFQHRVIRMSVPTQVATVFSARGISDLPHMDFSLGESDNGEGMFHKLHLFLVNWLVNVCAFWVQKIIIHL